MITSAVFLLKKYVGIKRGQIVEALREEEAAVIEPSQSLITTLREAQTLVDNLDASVKSLDTSLKLIDKKICDKLTMATAQQEMLRSRRNKHVIVDGNQLASAPSHNLLLLPSLPPSLPPSHSLPLASDFRCPFCPDRSYGGKPPLLRHISDVHSDRYQVFDYIFSLTPESVFNSSECSPAPDG